MAVVYDFMFIGISKSHGVTGCILGNSEKTHSLGNYLRDDHAVGSCFNSLSCRHSGWMGMETQMG